jgi:hypothetical protein
MALSETFPPTRTVNKTRVSRSVPAKTVKIPITARELVEWTYANQHAHRGGDPVGGGAGISQTGIVIERLLGFAALGCRVDVSSNAANVWGEMRCHEDAVTVHAVIGDLSARQRFLLIEHGKSRSTPDHEPKIFPLSCVPVPGKRGGERGIYLGSGRDLVGHEISYEGDWPSRDMASAHAVAADSHMRLWSDPSNWPATRRRRSDRPVHAEHEWSPSPYRRCADEVRERAHAEYRAWYEALWALCDGLEASGPRGLSRYRISDLGAAYEPWRQ